MACTLSTSIRSTRETGFCFRRMAQWTRRHFSKPVTCLGWGCCTLATCKPQIRKRAKAGDWIVGTGSVSNVGNDRIIYAMRVDEVLPLDGYDADRRFRKKRPRMAGSARQQVGDNIYFRTRD